ncbi:hypothetical protein IFR05_006095 [Cadophora sp. M221]|nr:hypothetical protein IFR05_006095 [Cadophora sp. M221]
MAARRESKDDRHIKPTRRRFSPNPKQRKRSSSVPITGSGKRMKLIDWPETKVYPTRTTNFRRSPGLSPDVERTRAECSRGTTKKTRTVIGNKSADMGRSKEVQGKLEIELVKLMGGVRLGAREKSQPREKKEGGKKVEEENDERVEIKMEEVEDTDMQD